MDDNFKNVGSDSSKTKRNVKAILKKDIEEELVWLKNSFGLKINGSIELDADCDLVVNFIKSTKSKYKHLKGGDVTIDKKTIKRMFGIEKYNGRFSLKTLSIAAHALGFKDWYDFILSTAGYDKTYDLYELDLNVESCIIQLKIGTKIRFILGSYSKSFIVRKNEDHGFSYTLLANIGLKLKRKVGDSFYAPSFLIEETDSLDNPTILIDNSSGWFDEPEQADLKKQADYLIL